TADRAHGLAQVNALNGGTSAFHFTIVDGSGASVFPAGEKLPFAWPSARKPAAPYEYASLAQDDAGRDTRALIRFAGRPVQYLYVALDRGRSRSADLFFWAFSSLIVSVLLGLAFSMWLLFRSLREVEKSRMALLQELAHDLRTPVASLKNLLDTLGARDGA